MSLAILEDISQLPTCPRCRMEVKLRRFSDRWVPYELSPVNKMFVGSHPGLLPFDKEFVFIPHTLCCGAGPCPQDPGLMRMWEKNRERNEARGDKHLHPLYGEIIPANARDVAARLHIKLMNNRSINLTKSDAVAILDYMVSKGTYYVGGPEVSLRAVESVTYANQCTATSSKTKRQCTQRTNDPSGKCFAHRDKPACITPAEGT